MATSYSYGVLQREAIAGAGSLTRDGCCTIIVVSNPALVSGLSNWFKLNLHGGRVGITQLL